MCNKIQQLFLPTYISDKVNFSGWKYCHKKSFLIFMLTDEAGVRIHFFAETYWARAIVLELKNEQQKCQFLEEVNYGWKNALHTHFVLRIYEFTHSGQPSAATSWPVKVRSLIAIDIFYVIILGSYAALWKVQSSSHISSSSQPCSQITLGKEGCCNYIIGTADMANAQIRRQ